MNELVTVTGAGGFIGSVLVARLLDAGYGVRAFDRFFFGEDVLSSQHGRPRLEVRTIDTRAIVPGDLEGSWAVLDLAALSNDHSGDLNPALTQEINEVGRIGVAGAARSAGVPRYLFASSCAVYGAGDRHNLDEEAPLRPLTAYARSCARAEAAVLSMSGPSFAATALRNATVYGLSPRMRFDLVVNQMTLNAFESGRITVAGDGRQWRPLVHVQDVATAFIKALEAPAHAVSGEAFNIGGANFQVRDIASKISRALPRKVTIAMVPGNADQRSYHVSFAKARSALNFTARKSIADGAIEVYRALKARSIENSERAHTGPWYGHLLRNELITLAT
jgi:nucleoside-diphosphate-sugar epimerase